MKLSDIKSSGHWPTLLTSFLYFDFSFMVWTLLGALGPQIAESLHLSAGQKGLMVAVPILGGAILRLVFGLLFDRLGGKTTGILAQLVVMVALLAGWIFGLRNYEATLIFGFVLGVAGASFAVALPQAGRWYPPHMQGVVLGLAGAGNVGVVLDSLIAPRLAAVYGWQAVFGFALIPAVLTFLVYVIFSKDAPGVVVKKKLSDYLRLLKEKDAHWFCFYYLISFGGFVGLASYYGLYFKSEFGFSAIKAGDFAALCTFVGAIARPIGGAIADRVGGVRAMLLLYTAAGIMMIASAGVHQITINTLLFVGTSAVLGMCNGSIFQLLPQRFGRDIGVMTGLVGCAGGIGGFYLASSLGFSKQQFGNCSIGFIAFGLFCFVAVAGLSLIKTRWRTTWGASAQARI
jgi:MFS transporter, NNP family, nitrate/nitrite transporter